MTNATQYLDTCKRFARTGGVQSALLVVEGAKRFADLDVPSMDTLHGARWVLGRLGIRETR